MFISAERFEYLSLDIRRMKIRPRPIPSWLEAHQSLVVPFEVARLQSWNPCCAAIREQATRNGSLKSMPAVRVEAVASKSRWPCLTGTPNHPMLMDYASM